MQSLSDVLKENYRQNKNTWDRPVGVVLYVIELDVNGGLANVRSNMMVYISRVLEKACI